MRSIIADINHKVESSAEWKEGETCRAIKKGSTMIIDCSHCQRGRSLESDRCLPGVLRCMSELGGVRRVLLSGNSELLYQQDCVSLLSSLVRAIDFCRSQHYFEPFDDCPSCPSNPNRLFKEIANDILSYWDDKPKPEPVRIGTHRAACERCSSSTLSNLGHLKSMLASLERDVARDMFHIVEED